MAQMNSGAFRGLLNVLKSTEFSDSDLHTRVHKGPECPVHAQKSNPANSDAWCSSRGICGTPLETEVKEA